MSGQGGDRHGGTSLGWQLVLSLEQKVSKCSPNLCDLRAGTRGIILVSVTLERRKGTPDHCRIALLGFTAPKQ